MNRVSLACCFLALSVSVQAQQMDPCARLAGAELQNCQLKAQLLEQQQLTEQQQQLARLQEQLTQQQRQIAQQQELLKQQHEQLAHQQEQIAEERDYSRRTEALHAQSEHESATSRAAAAQAAERMQRADIVDWKAQNPWYGSDYARTQFAMRYARELHQERPDLLGRPFYDAIAAKVRQTYGPGK